MGKGSGSIRRGRPPAPTEKAKRHSLGIRTNAVLKARIESAAWASGRSVAQEAEYRLDRSFDADVAEAVYGPQASALLELLGRMLRSVSGIRGLPIEGNWLDDAKAYDAAAHAVAFIFDQLRPKGKGLSPSEAGQVDALCRRFLISVADENPGQPWSSWATRTRNALGPEMAERIINWRRDQLASTEPEDR